VVHLKKWAYPNSAKNYLHFHHAIGGVHHHKELLKPRSRHAGSLHRDGRLGLRSRGLSPEALEQVLTASESAEQRALEKGLGQLGTIGSNAPFIGLFGTVCGILDAFAALGRDGAGPQSVMTAIAEALIATAVGLAVAIPAIWVYNVLQGRALELVARARELRTLMVAASLEAAARGADRKG